MDFPLPPVGEGLIEVELVRWLVRPGDAVVPGQGLAEVMSDKASMEVPAPFGGTITELTAVPGTKVKVGERFLTYHPVGAAGEQKPTPSRKSEPEALATEQRKPEAGTTEQRKTVAYASGSDSSNGHSSTATLPP